MLQEMKIEDALKKFLQGKKVLVMYDETDDKPAFTVEPLEVLELHRQRLVIGCPDMELINLGPEKSVPLVCTGKKIQRKETAIISEKRDTAGTAVSRTVTSIWRISVKKLYQVKTVQGKIVEEGALLEDIAQKLGSSTEKLHAAMSQGYAVYGLYILVPVDFALSRRDKMLLIDFDHTRKELLAAGRKE